MRAELNKWAINFLRADPLRADRYLRKLPDRENFILRSVVMEGKDIDTLEIPRMELHAGGGRNAKGVTEDTPLSLSRVNALYYKALAWVREMYKSGLLDETESAEKGERYD